MSCRGDPTRGASAAVTHEWGIGCGAGQRRHTLFLLATQILTGARVSRRDAAWRTAEILLLHHQLTVLQRQLGERARPKTVWADRALIALLLGLIPRARHPQMRLIVTPGTTLRWRRDLLRRRWTGKSRPKGRPRTHRNIKILVLRMAREDEG